MCLTTSLCVINPCDCFLEHFLSQYVQDNKMAQKIKIYFKFI